MKGLVQKIEAKISKGKFFHPDYRMNDGSIFFFNAKNPEQKLTSVPVNGSKITNLAWLNFARIKYGYETSENLSDTFKNSLSASVTNTLQAGKSIAEITNKGGLHVIISQVSDVDDGNDLIFNLPADIVNYMKDNIARGFLIEVWDRKTRLATTSTSADFYVLFQNGSNNICNFLRNGVEPTTQLGTVQAGNVLGNRRNAVGVSAITGNPTSNILSQYKFGSGGPYGSFELNKASSQILYSLHITDLSSAKTESETIQQCYTRLVSKSLSEYTKDFSTGGIYDSDTFTSPSTLP